MEATVIVTVRGSRRTRCERTVVCTDMEGSTRLLTELGPHRYADILQLHRRLLRESWRRSDGEDRGTEGDGSLVSFRDSAAALTACAEAQQALAAYPWPGCRKVRVRMGVTSGEVHQVGSDLIGIAVHLAARIAEAAHGGQVLIGSAVSSSIGPALCLRDVGEHYLPGFDQPERLCQLLVDGVTADFPPPRSRHDSYSPMAAAGPSDRLAAPKWEYRQCERV